MYTNREIIISVAEEDLLRDGYSIVKTAEEAGDGAWYKLTEEQQQFRTEHPEATTEEVILLRFIDPIEKEGRDSIVAKLKERINTRVNRDILSGFRWKDYPVWLSVENQTNYKAAYDLAFQAQVLQQPFTPVKFKFGTDEEPVYHAFSDFEEFAGFYISAVTYIQTCYEKGWAEKDALEKMTNDELITLFKTTV